MIKELMTSNRKEQELDYNKILKNQALKNEFLLSIKSDVLNGSKVNYLTNLFKLINSIAFAGFDYYYIDDMKNLLKESDSSEIEPKIDMLINEEQIDKLRTTIECFSSLEFIDVKDKNYIWYRNTNVYCDLIPFERKDNELLIKENGEIIKTIKDSYNTNMYNDLEYKLIK